jgi:hypothetical protein
MSEAPFACARERAYRDGFFGSPCVPSPVLGIRTTRLPLLLLWEKELGDEGQKHMGMKKRFGALSATHTSIGGSGQTPLSQACRIARLNENTLR